MVTGQWQYKCDNILETSVGRVIRFHRIGERGPVYVEWSGKESFIPGKEYTIWLEETDVWGNAHVECSQILTTEQGCSTMVYACDNGVNFLGDGIRLPDRPAGTYRIGQKYRIVWYTEQLVPVME